MAIRTLAHLSDLHLGRSPEHDRAAAALALALEEAEVDQVVVTGDLTHRGSRAEYERFEHSFRRLLRAERVVVVPGNHDRLGEDVGAEWMGGDRVCVVRAGGLYLVQVDSTGPHNRSVFRSDGAVCEAVLEQIDRALDAAPAGALCVMALHHHLLPLPEESIAERLATWVGLPHALELSTGRQLLALADGRCDLILHGHRHVPREVQKLAHHGRHLGIFNAGSSTELGGFRVFTHAHGALLEQPFWLEAPVRIRLTPSAEPSFAA